MDLVTFAPALPLLSGGGIFAALDPCWPSARLDLQTPGSHDFINNTS